MIATPGIEAQMFFIFPLKMIFIWKKSPQPQKKREQNSKNVR